jgi:hypothetical protein
MTPPKKTVPPQRRRESSGSWRIYSERYKERYRADPSIKKKKVQWRENNREYSLWRAMHQRCEDSKSSPTYKAYRGRGISVCRKWSGENGYQNFLADMGRRPSKKHTLDRKNNNKGYFPKNCRWVVRTVQMRNTRANVVISYKGERKTLAEWADDVGIKYHTLYGRLITHGWSPRRAFTKGVA